MSILARLYKFNVIVHQVDFKDMAQEFHPWDTRGLKVVHLTYHRGRHYNSVRSVLDTGRFPATDFKIKHALVPGSEPSEKDKPALGPHDEQSRWDIKDYAEKIFEDLDDRWVFRDAWNKVFDDNHPTTEAQVNDKMYQIIDQYTTLEHEQAEEESKRFQDRLSFYSSYKPSFN